MALNGIWPLSRRCCYKWPRGAVGRILVRAVSDREIHAHSDRDSSTPTARDGGEIGIGPQRGRGSRACSSRACQSEDMLGLGSVRRDENWPFDGREQRNPPLRRAARAVALSVVSSHSFFGPQTSPWPPHSSSQTQGVILKPRSHSLALGPFT